METQSISSIESQDLFSTEISCPHGFVEGVMKPSTSGVLTASPMETLEATIERLNKVTGLPVLDEAGKVIGVLSRKDIIKVRRANGSMQQLVADHMTSPAIVVPATASVQQAADLMLSKNIRRLPVVDANGFPLGIVSRSDIFKPLWAEAYDIYMEKEKEALKGSSTAPAAPAKPPPTWELKYLYDGDCPMCQSLKNVLTRQDNNRGLIKFVNIADDDYRPKANMGISYDEAMETIHVITNKGDILQGTEALRALFTLVGLGWAVKLSESPLLAKIVDAVYEFLSANRLSLGGTMDAIIAAKRMDMSKKGVETCEDVDEACTAEW